MRITFQASAGVYRAVFVRNKTGIVDRRWAGKMREMKAFA
jgi:hypothetical protein